MKSVPVFNPFLAVPGPSQIQGPGRGSMLCAVLGAGGGGR